MTKIIYAIRSKAHFSYHQSSIDALKKQSKVELIIAFDKHWSTQSKQGDVAFNHWHKLNEKIKTTYFPIRKDFLRRPLMWFRELRSFNNYCTRNDDYEFYRNRWAHYLKLPVKWRELVLRKKYHGLLGSKLLRKLLTLIERISPADRKIIEWLRKEKPDVLIASPCNMRFSHEIELVKAAKKLGIATVIPVLSWDNTSTKGLFHIHPSRILAWHKGHMADCTNFHGITEKRISITGAPFFDKWRGAMELANPRADFCQRVGLDPNKHFVLYLGSSSNIAPDETWLVQEIKMALAKSSVIELKEMQVLFRAHPSNWKNGLRLLNEDIAVWPREGTLPDSAETFNDFRDSLAHAQCVIGLNTSGMLDAIINNKPVISPLVEKYSLTQEKAEHFIRMRKNGVLYIADDVNAVLSQLLNIIKGDDPREAARKTFVYTYIWPRGSRQSAGDWVAREVLSLLPPVVTIQDDAKDNLQNNLLEVEIEDLQVSDVNVDTDIAPIFSNLIENVEKEKHTPLYKSYLQMRDRILNLMTEYKMSAYWYEEVMGFDYMFDASPLIISKIREHCYHITGERGYNYRKHHSHKAKPYLVRLVELRAIDKSGLFVPETPLCGGFGYTSKYGMVNLDTLKFYEVLIGLDKAGLLNEFGDVNSERKAVVEIGSGWGGFAYQFCTLFKNTTYFCIDLPPTMIFSAVYLRGVFPDAKIAIFGDMPAIELFERWKEFDFIFIPANKIDEFRPLKLDMAINMVSFQEMTSEQVSVYIQKLAELGCQNLYSLNRDKSLNNHEISSVSSLISERYDSKVINVLPTEYCSVGIKKPAKQAANNNPNAYRHLACELKTA